MTAWCYPTLLVVVFRSGTTLQGWWPWATFWHEWNSEKRWWSADDDA